MPKQTFLNLTAQKQRNIVYAALNEFTDKGYTLSNIGTIAKNASVAKGSMYQYFEDKKEFYLYLMDYAYSMVKTTLRIQLEDAIQKVDKKEELINHWNTIFWDCINNYQAEVCFSIATLREQDADIRNRVLVWQKEYRKSLIEPQIIKLKEDNKIRDDIDVEFMSLYCQNVSMICKELIIRSVVVDEQTNQLTLMLHKDEWNITFTKLSQMLFDGIVFQ